ncbi:MAG: malonyl-ACP O-methyltransferase BioC [Betaproteobacteria bacterium]|nr:MAG: malonyl-ACP O-methyltransferase BioC [Betaproteobacteria bacterium]
MLTLSAARRARLRRSFDRAAAGFDDVATLPREIAKRMSERLALMRLPVRCVLDAGCGTGHGANLLRQRYRSALIIELDLSERMLRHAARRRRLPWPLSGLPARRVTVCADIQKLPLTAASIDLVWSNLALHWLEDLPAAFSQLHRVLRPGGLLMFSILGPDTLKELRAASAGDAFHVNPHRDMHDIGDMLVACGYADPVMDMEHVTLTYVDVPGLLRDLRAHGSIGLVEPQRKDLGGVGDYHSTLARYEQFRRNDKRMPATFEVIYGHAWKPQAKISPTGKRVIDIRSTQA